MPASQPGSPDSPAQPVAYRHVPQEPDADPSPSPAAGVGLALAVAAGVALRLYTVSELWLDEALSVNIAALPLSEIPDALRRDGAPPLYYVLLHGWMQVFGDGNFAVRALSALFGVLALPLAWIAGRRLAGRPGAVASLLIVATSPFAMRYSTETRMYALVQLLVLAGYVLVHKALSEERPRLATLAGIAVVSGLLPLTHYWSLYLLAALGLGLLVAAIRRGGDRGRYVRVLVAVLAGGVLFLPWLGVFLYQAAHTGTPWGTPALPFDAILTTFNDIGGGGWGASRVLGLVLAALVMLGIAGRALDGRRIEIDLRTRPGVRAEVAVALATFAIALGASFVSGNAYASRYASVLVPLLLLAAAYGTTVFADRRVRAGLLAMLALLGIVGGIRNSIGHRTQAAEAARVIERAAAPGDIVAACPDQLSVSVGRLLPDRLRPRSFPDLDRSGLVDWVDYAERNDASPKAFAKRLDALAGDDNGVWLVWAPGYRTLGTRCERVSSNLAALRPGSDIELEAKPLFERHYVTYAPPRR